MNGDPAAGWLEITRVFDAPVEDLVEKYMARAGSMVRSGTGREMGLLAAEEFVNKKLIRVAG